MPVFLVHVDHFVVGSFVKLFEWSLYQPHGKTIYWTTTVIYVIIFVLSVLCLNQVRKRFAWSSWQSMVSLVCVLLGTVAAEESIRIQGTSLYPQATQHLTTTLIIAGAMLVNVALAYRRFRVLHLIAGLTIFSILSATIAALGR